MASLRYGDPYIDYDAYSYICYAPEDIERVRAAADKLFDAGFLLWMEEKDASYLRDVTAVADGIQGSSMVIVFLSGHSARDETLMISEFAYAASVLRKDCLPVWLEDIPDMPSAPAMMTASHPRITPDELPEYMTRHFKPDTRAASGGLKDRQVIEKPCRAYEGDMPYAFISYSHDDARTVYPIIKNVFEEGWELWYDEGIRLTDRYIPVISEHVKNCTVFVLMLTDNAVRSRFVMSYELAYAESLGKPIICIAAEAVRDTDMEAAQLWSMAVEAESLGELLQTYGVCFAGKREAVPPARRDNVEYDVFFPGSQIKNFDFRVENDSITLTAYHGGESEVEIPSEHESVPVTALGDFLFQKKKNIHHIKIPDSVTTIGRLCFVGCLALTELYIPESVTSCGECICAHSMTIRCAENSFAHFYAVKYANQQAGAKLTAELMGTSAGEAIAEEKVKRLAPGEAVDNSVNAKSQSFSPDKPFAIFCCEAGIAETLRPFVADFVADGFNILWQEDFTDEALDKCECFIISYPIFDEEHGKAMNSLRRMLRRDPSRILQIFWTGGNDCPKEVLPLLTDRQGLSAADLTHEEFVGTLKKALTDRGCHIGHARRAQHPDFQIVKKAGGIEISKYTGKDAKVVIPESIFTPPQPVVGIGVGAFEDCVTMEAVEIPASVTYIGDCAFGGCAALKLVAFPSGIKTMSYCVLWGCSALEAFEIPDGVERIEKAAFEECVSLERIVIPNSVTEIAAQAFSSCEALREAYIPKSVTSIHEHAFVFCDELTIYTPRGSYAWRYAKTHRIKRKPAAV